jgi:DNA-binding NarL/FixJ family response regulator
MNQNTQDLFFTIDDVINLKIAIENLLTNQEIKIIKLASETFSNKEIAQKLFLAEGTVKKHRENVYQKLNVHGKANIRKFLRIFKNNIF